LETERREVEGREGGGCCRPAGEVGELDDSLDELDGEGVGEGRHGGWWGGPARSRRRVEIDFSGKEGERRGSLERSPSEMTSVLEADFATI